MEYCGLFWSSRSIENVATLYQDIRTAKDTFDVLSSKLRLRQGIQKQSDHKGCSM
jgi:hypothetical protein